MEAKQSFGSRFRPLRGLAKPFHDALLLSLALLGAVWSLEIHSDLGIIIFKEQFLALIFMIGMVAVFLAVPARAGDSDARTPWYDYGLAALSAVVGGFGFAHGQRRYVSDGLRRGHLHDLLNDIDKDVVVADIKEWIGAHLPAV